MAFSASTAWDTRTTGSDGNGGGFNTASSGTDYSVQDSPQVTYTDLVIDATTNTKCTSAAHPFTSVHVGNVINITSGTGFTVQRVQIVSVTSSVATCDKSLGTLSSTGGNGVLGGGLATIAAANGLLVTGNAIWIQSGTYVLTSAVTISALNITVSGYGTTHGDYGTRPLITTATNSTTLFNVGNGGTSQPYSFINLSLSNTASTRAVGVNSLNGAPGIFYRCLLDGFSSGIDRNISPSGFWATLYIDECEVKNCSGAGVKNIDHPTVIVNSNMNHNGQGVVIGANSSPFVFVNSLFVDNGYGIENINNDVSSTVYAVSGCTFANNSSDGFKPGSAGGGQQAAAVLGITNSIFYGNGGYGVDCILTPVLTSVNRANAYGANSSGARLNYPVGQNDVVLTADPFANAGSGDYSLNNISGGGLLLRGTGVQWGSL